MYSALGGSKPKKMIMLVSSGSTVQHGKHVKASPVAFGHFAVGLLDHHRCLVETRRCDLF